MRRRTRRAGASALFVALLGTVVAGPGTSPSRDASAATPARFVTGWIPNWSGSAVTEGTRAITQGSDSVFAEVSPFGFSAVAADRIATSGTETNLTNAVNALRSRGLPVVPSITDGTGRLVMATILDNAATRTLHVQTITNLVVSRGYDGIDLDYEGFAFTDPRSSWDATRPDWVAFIAELGAALRANGKLLAVTVPPVWNNGTSGYWVYDIAGMLPHVDRLRLMVYDWSVGQPGPIGPLSWQANVLSTLEAIIPADQLDVQRSKIQIGVNAYGRSWATVTSGVCPSGASIGTVAVQMESAAALAAQHGATPVRDASGELRFTYDVAFTGSRDGAIPAPTPPTPTTRANSTAPIDDAALAPAMRLSSGGTVSCTVRRTVFVPDEFTIVQRTNAVLAEGYSGIAIWALGYETPGLWGPLSGIDVPRGPGGPAPVGSLDAVIGGPSAVAVQGWAVDPEFDLPITITITVTPPGGTPTISGPIIARGLRPDLTMYPSRTHGFDAGAPIPAPVGSQVCVHARGYGAAATAPTLIGCRTA
jgi:spore germination protein YaaH